MSRPRIYVTRQVFDEAIALLEEAGDVEVWQGNGPPPSETLGAALRDVHGLFSLLTECIDAPLLEAAPRLRVVSNMAVGYDNIDVAAATERGIYVGNTPGVLTETTADFAFALLSSWVRRIPEAQRYARDGSWKHWGPMTLLGSDLHGATLGIVGMGRIGEAMARRAAGFGMRIIYHSRTRKPALERELGLEWFGSLDGLLPEADFLSLHVPSLPETKHLIGEAELRAMRSSAVLVNTTRGEIVDQAALTRALTGGVIAGAALDVTDPEPMRSDDPLLAMDNVIVTPHIASASHATRLKMAMMAAQNIVDVFQGRPPTNWVNPDMPHGH
jgi:glyoxylate reductase